MRRRRTKRRSTMLTALVLAAAGIYLGVRSWALAEVAFAPQAPAAEPRIASTTANVEAAKVRDRSLTALRPPTRNPFRPPRATRQPAERRTTPAPTPVPDPQLRMILYDQVSPEVQLAVDGELSGRLRPGQSFRGWRVVSISARACVVENDGRVLTLAPRRSP